MKKRFLYWTVAWVELVVVLIEIVTFGCWRPEWAGDYLDYTIERG